MNCPKCNGRAHWEGVDYKCSKCGHSFEEDEYEKEYRKDIASIYRAKNFSIKQIEEYWKKQL